jgi:glycosyltransferase involved in cell wall biosynthesis
VSQPLHIGIDASRIAVAARTGTEHYTYELLAALAQHDRVSRYTLYCNQLPAALPPLGPNFALRHIPFPRLWTHVRLSAELALHPPDVLFVPAHVLPLGAPLRRTRTVVTIHDMGYLHFPEAHTPMHRRYLRLSTLWSARAADRVIAISAATHDDLVRYTGVRPDKIAVIHHGVSERFRPVVDRDVMQATQRRYGITAPYFCYIGTLQPRKNLVRLIEAFAQFDERRKTKDERSMIATHIGEPSSFVLRPSSETSALRLVIAGKKGWLTEAIERRADEVGVADRVSFIGYLPDDDVPALLSGALGFVFPSLYEGFGMPVLEAMACGAPVLASDSSSLPEVAGDAALLVDPTDVGAIAAGLARLANDASLRADLRARGLARAAQFTWERCAVQTLEVLQNELSDEADGNRNA